MTPRLLGIQALFMEILALKKGARFADVACKLSVLKLQVGSENLLTESTAHAAAGAKMVAVFNCQRGAVTVNVSAGVGGVRSHAVTQITTLVDDGH